MKVKKSAAIWILFFAIIISLSIGSIFYFLNHRLNDYVHKNAFENIKFTQQHIEEYFSYIATIPQFLSLHEDVIAMNKNSHDYIEAIVEHYYGKNLLSELYIIESDFEGTKRPFMTIEIAEKEEDIDEIHSLEREQEEYLTQVRQIRRFKRDPSLKAQISSPVKLCVDEKGIIYSVPIRKGDKLAGIVSAMLPEENISRALDMTGNGHEALLFNDRGDIILCGSVSRTLRPWFDFQLQKYGFEELVKKQDQLTKVGDYDVLIRKVNLHDNNNWYLGFWFNPMEHLGLKTFVFEYLGYISAGMIFLIGVILAFCSTKVYPRKAVDEHVERLNRDWEYKVQQLSSSNQSLESEKASEATQEAVV